MDETDLQQTESLLTIYELQLSQLPQGDPMIPLLKANITKLKALISPPPPPIPTVPANLIPPSLASEIRPMRDLPPELVAAALEFHNKTNFDNELDYIDLVEFSKVKKERLKLFFRVFWYCGGFFCAPPQTHPAWDQFVSAVGEDIAKSQGIYDLVKVE